MLAFVVLAAPAATAIFPGNGFGGGDSVLPDPLGRVDDPLNPLLPGDDDLGDMLDESLGNVPGLAAPKSEAKPAPVGKGPTSAAPATTSPRAKSPAKRVGKPGRTSGNGSRSNGWKSSDAPAGPIGSSSAVRPKRNFDHDPINRPSRQSSPIGPGPAAPNSFVGSVVDRIPAQYRWPVVVLASLSLLFAFTSLRERRRSLRVERAALVDSLTGLPNRPAFSPGLRRSGDVRSATTGP